MFCNILIIKHLLKSFNFYRKKFVQFLVVFVKVCTFASAIENETVVILKMSSEF